MNKFSKLFMSKNNNDVNDSQKNGELSKVIMSTMLKNSSNDEAKSSELKNITKNNIEMSKTVIQNINGKGNILLLNELNKPTHINNNSFMKHEKKASSVHGLMKANYDSRYVKSINSVYNNTYCMTNSYHLNNPYTFQNGKYGGNTHSANECNSYNCPIEKEHFRNVIKNTEKNITNKQKYIGNNYILGNNTNLTRKLPQNGRLYRENNRNNYGNEYHTDGNNMSIRKKNDDYKIGNNNFENNAIGLLPHAYVVNKNEEVYNNITKNGKAGRSLSQINHNEIKNGDQNMNVNSLYYIDQSNNNLADIVKKESSEKNIYYDKNSSTKNSFERKQCSNIIPPSASQVQIVKTRENILDPNSDKSSLKENPNFLIRTISHRNNRNMKVMETEKSNKDCLVTTVNDQNLKNCIDKEIGEDIHVVRNGLKSYDIENRRNIRNNINEKNGCGIISNNGNENHALNVSNLKCTNIYGDKNQLPRSNLLMNNVGNRILNENDNRNFNKINKGNFFNNPSDKSSKFKGGLTNKMLYIEPIKDEIIYVNNLTNINVPHLNNLYEVEEIEKSKIKCNNSSAMEILNDKKNIDKKNGSIELSKHSQNLDMQHCYTYSTFVDKINGNYNYNNNYKTGKINQEVNNSNVYEKRENLNNNFYKENCNDGLKNGNTNGYENKSVSKDAVKKINYNGENDANKPNNEFIKVKDYLNIHHIPANNEQSIKNNYKPNFHRIEDNAHLKGYYYDSNKGVYLMKSTMNFVKPQDTCSFISTSHVCNKIDENYNNINYNIGNVNHSTINLSDKFKGYQKKCANKPNTDIIGIKYSHLNRTNLNEPYINYNAKNLSISESQPYNKWNSINYDNKKDIRHIACANNIHYSNGNYNELVKNNNEENIYKIADDNLRSKEKTHELLHLTRDKNFMYSGDINKIKNEAKENRSIKMTGGDEYEINNTVMGKDKIIETGLIPNNVFLENNINICHNSNTDIGKIIKNNKLSCNEANNANKLYNAGLNNCQNERYSIGIKEGKKFTISQIKKNSKETLTDSYKYHLNNMTGIEKSKINKKGELKINKWPSNEKGCDMYLKEGSKNSLRNVNTEIENHKDTEGEREENEIENDGNELEIEKGKNMIILNKKFNYPFNDELYTSSIDNNKAEHDSDIINVKCISYSEEIIHKKDGNNLIKEMQNKSNESHISLEKNAEIKKKEAVFNKQTNNNISGYSSSLDSKENYPKNSNTENFYKNGKIEKGNAVLEYNKKFSGNYMDIIKNDSCSRDSNDSSSNSGSELDKNDKDSDENNSESNQSDENDIYNCSSGDSNKYGNIFLPANDADIESKHSEVSEKLCSKKDIKTNLLKKKNNFPWNKDNIVKLNSKSKLLKMKNITINTKLARYERVLIHTCINKLNWKKCIDNTNKGILYWIGYNINDFDHYNYMKKKKIINRIPSLYMYTKKKALTFLLSHLSLIFPSLYDFYPNTFVLPENKEIIKYILNGNNKDYYIMKPDCGSMGIGVKIINKYSDININILNGYNCYIIQRYIDNPLLMYKKKFDFRIYILLLPGKNYPKIYISRVGFARLCTEEYKKKKQYICNTFVHLTNYSINKDNDKYVRKKNIHDKNNNKQLLSDVFIYLKNNGYDIDDIWKQIKKITCLTSLAIYSYIKEKIKNNFNNNFYFYQLIGLDILLDANGKAWLLEVNSNPSLRIDYIDPGYANFEIQLESMFDRYVKEPVISEMFLIIYKKIYQKYLRKRSKKGITNGVNTISTITTTNSNNNKVEKKGRQNITFNNNGSNNKKRGVKVNPQNNLPNNSIFSFHDKIIKGLTENKKKYDNKIINNYSHKEKFKFLLARSNKKKNNNNSGNLKSEINTTKHFPILGKSCIKSEYSIVSNNNRDNLEAENADNQLENKNLTNIDINNFIKKNNGAKKKKKLFLKKENMSNVDTCVDENDIGSFSLSSNVKNDVSKNENLMKEDKTEMENRGEKREVGKKEYEDSKIIKTNELNKNEKTKKEWNKNKNDDECVINDENCDRDNILRKSIGCIKNKNNSYGGAEEYNKDNYSINFSDDNKEQHTKIINSGGVKVSQHNFKGNSNNNIPISQEIKRDDNSCDNSFHNYSNSCFCINEIHGCRNNSDEVENNEIVENSVHGDMTGNLSDDMVNNSGASYTSVDHGKVTRKDGLIESNILNNETYVQIDNQEDIQLDKFLNNDIEMCKSIYRNISDSIYKKKIENFIMIRSSLYKYMNCLNVLGIRYINNNEIRNIDELYNKNTPLDFKKTYTKVRKDILHPLKNNILEKNIYINLKKETSSYYKEMKIYNDCYMLFDFILKKYDNNAKKCNKRVEYYIDKNTFLCMCADMKINKIIENIEIPASTFNSLFEGNKSSHENEMYQIVSKIFKGKNADVDKSKKEKEQDGDFNIQKNCSNNSCLSNANNDGNDNSLNHYYKQNCKKEETKTSKFSLLRSKRESLTKNNKSTKNNEKIGCKKNTTNKKIRNGKRSSNRNSFISDNNNHSSIVSNNNNDNNYYSSIFCPFSLVSTSTNLINFNMIGHNSMKYKSKKKKKMNIYDLEYLYTRQVFFSKYINKNQGLTLIDFFLLMQQIALLIFPYISQDYACNGIQSYNCILFDELNNGENNISGNETNVKGVNNIKKDGKSIKKKGENDQDNSNYLKKGNKGHITNLPKNSTKDGQEKTQIINEHLKEENDRTNYNSTHMEDKKKHNYTWHKNICSNIYNLYGYVQININPAIKNMCMETFLNFVFNKYSISYP
ncbi:tubulin--tyrosine ligase, putative [Plasmodium chabaudi adami]|uniref:Tubulin--tyrosine ligase, putative n=1 Tax=Plasmodium chabaudi adami TaxID=5826 RepID=A0A1C6XJ01_PLACE|nr:tubulin--tyrosine ligase, putative [Plasmodium chabaudi adami]